MTLTHILLIIIAFAALLIVALYQRNREIRKQRDALLNEKDVAYAFVHDVGDVFAESADISVDALLARVLFYAQRTTRAGAGALYMLDAGGEQFEARAISGMFPPIVGGVTTDLDKPSGKLKSVEWMVKSQPAEFGKGLVGKVAASASSLLIQHAEVDSRVPEFDQEYLQIHSILLVPMRYRDKSLGVIALTNPIDGEPFSAADLNLLEALADQACVSMHLARQSAALEEKSRMDRDLSIASEIQTALLPHDIPSQPGINISDFSIPAQGIGGDYYDFIQLDKDHLGIVIADVSGKGISGALVMAICRSILRMHAPGTFSPAAVLKSSNRAINRDLQEDIFISVLYMVLNTQTRSMTIARAGHICPFICGPGREKCLTIESEGMAIGIADSDSFEDIIEEKTIQLQPGDTVIAYTDGVSEAMNSEEQEWGEENLVETVRKTVEDSGDALRVTEEIRQSLMSFVGSQPQYDDMTLVAIQVEGDRNA